MDIRQQVLLVPVVCFLLNIIVTYDVALIRNPYCIRPGRVGLDSPPLAKDSDVGSKAAKATVPPPMAAPKEDRPKNVSAVWWVNNSLSRTGNFCEFRFGKISFCPMRAFKKS
jgi:hypothetical protein